MRFDGMDSYQVAAVRFATDDWRCERPHDVQQMRRLAQCSLGVAGEAGEVCDIVKKHVAHGHDLDVDKLTRELGDVLWYVAMMSRMIGVDLSSVVRANINKLNRRYPDGFSVERSINRVDDE